MAIAAIEGDPNPLDMDLTRARPGTHEPRPPGAESLWRGVPDFLLRTPSGGMRAQSAANRYARTAVSIVIPGDHGGLAFALGRQIKPCYLLVWAFGTGNWSRSSHKLLNHPEETM